MIPTFRDGDIIAATATPPGRGALALIRISGPGTADLVGRVFRSKAEAEPRRARVGELVHPETGEIIDRAVAVLYAAPASYTGEDMAEVSVHAGPAVVNAALEALYAAGARPAEPGEFTWRAVGNGKMDLAAAQAVADLADARTAGARADALRRLGGELSREVNALRERVISARALLEAAVEFDQDVAPEEIAAIVAEAEEGARRLVEESRDREALVEGLTVALAGPRNAGKSTLFNRLLGEDRSIVSATPGTTTDRVDAPYVAGGILFRLSDGAGLDAEGDNGVEAEGIRRARDYLSRAAYVIWLDDATSPPPPMETTGKAALEPSDVSVPPERLIRVLNKCDLPAAEGRPEGDGTRIRVSAMTGEGVDILIGELVARAKEGEGNAADGAPLSLSARERSLLVDAGRSLGRARELVLEDAAEELAAEELRLAAASLGRIVGEIDIDEVYGEVFSRFCIGK
ncbi:MAG: tRNA modification GTPase [Candidatus Zixiibacteriota bacterium]|jgi:tRNA modification GTPase